MGLTEDTKEPEEIENDIHKLAAFYAKQKGFAKYLQTSSLFGTNVKNVFDEAIEHTVNNRKQKSEQLSTQEDLESKVRNVGDKNKKKGHKCVIF